jgi:uncharacterized protein (TIGR02246 family)
MEMDALSGLVVRAETAWNTHDMAAFSGLFSADADFVNVAGWWWRGRDEIEAMHTRLHETIFSESHMEMRVLGTRQIDNAVYVVHVGWRMLRQRGGGVRQASEPRQGIWTWVVRAGDRLEIVASHNSDTLAMPTDHPLAAITGRAALDV